MIIAKNLANLRKQAKMTQQELAEKLNYTDKAVSKWERGEALPDILVLKQLADMYGVKVDDFLHEHEQPVVQQTPVYRKRALWGKMYVSAILISVIVWSVCCTIDVLIGVPNSGLLYLIGGVLQLLVVLWYLLQYIRKKMH